jgi:hypothetical protein
MITMAKPEPISDRVREKLDRLHHARRTRLTVQAIAWTLALLVALAAIAMALDGYFGWWSKGVRFLISATVFAAVIGSIVLGLRKILSPRRESELAKLADDKTPALQERMQTILSASHWSDPPTGIYRDTTARFQHDPIMQQLVAAETNRLVDRISPQEAAKDRKLFVPLIIGATGSFACLMIALWVGSDFTTLATRLIVPMADVTRHQLDGIPGDQVIAKGESWKLGLTASGPTASAVRLERELTKPIQDAKANVDLSESNITRESLTLKPKRGSTNEFRYRQRRLANSFRYRLSVGDLRTPWYQIVVAERPRITGTTIEVTPPSYTGLKPKLYRRMPNRITVIEGSTIKMVVTGAGDIDLGMLLIDNQPSRTMWSDDQQIFRVSFQIDSETVVSPQLLEPNGLQNLRSPKCHIFARPDLPPTVRIKTPRPDQKVRPDDNVTLTFQAKDDVGLAKARLVVESETEDGDAKTLDVIDLPVPLHKGEPIKDWKGKTQLDLSKYELSEGQSLSYRIETYDTKQAAILAQSENEVAKRSERDERMGSGKPIENLDTKKMPLSDSDSNTLESPRSQKNQSDATTKNSATKSGPASQPNMPLPKGSQQTAKDGVPNSSEPKQTDLGAANSGNANDMNRAGSRSNDKPKASSESMTIPNQNQSGEKQSAGEQSAGKQNRGKQSNAKPSMKPATMKDVAADKTAIKADAKATEKSKSNTDKVTQKLSDQSKQASKDKMPPTESERKPSDESKAEPSKTQASQKSGKPKSSQTQLNKTQSKETQSKETQPNQSSPSNRKTSGSKLTSSPEPSQEKNRSQESEKSTSFNPDSMQRRRIDIPRPSRSQRMRLKITENIGSYEGKARRKTEIAVAGTILRMQRELTSARKGLSGVLESQTQDQTWNADLQIEVNEANQHQQTAIDAVKDLMKRTKDTPYAFIGVQLAEITHTHIIPAAQDSGAVVDANGETRWSLILASRQQTVRAIERLRELYQTFERAKRDFDLAKDVQQVAKMYRVYLENSLAQLSKARKADPSGLKRTLAELELDEEYMKRLKEVLEMRNELRAELARILANDPRLMKRYFQNFGQRGESIRLQLSEVAKRQRLLHDQLGMYAQVEQQSQSAFESVLKRHANLMTNESLDLVQRAFEIEETFETWLPLQTNDSPIIEATRNAFLEFSSIAAGISSRYESGVGGKVLLGIANWQETKTNLLASSRSMAEFIDSADRVTAQLEQLARSDQQYADNSLRRVLELGQMRDQAARWNQKSKFLANAQFAPAIGVQQFIVALDTHLLTEKLTGLQTELARQIGGGQNTLPQSIAKACDALLQKLDRDIEPIQLAAIRALQKSLPDKALVRTQVASDGLDEACELLDTLLKDIIKRLDQLPPDPLADLSDDPTLDEILAILEQERDFAELLGIPLRPTNLQIMNDWANGSRGGKGGAGRARLIAMIQAALKAQGSKTDKKLKKIREKLAKANSQANLFDEDPEKRRRNVFGWNVVRSQLGSGLLQGSDGLPPEAYRRSIDRYFELISGTLGEPE